MRFTRRRRGAEFCLAVGHIQKFRTACSVPLSDTVVQASQGGYVRVTRCANRAFWLHRAHRLLNRPRPRWSAKLGGYAEIGAARVFLIRCRAARTRKFTWVGGFRMKLNRQTAFQAAPRSPLNASQYRIRKPLFEWLVGCVPKVVNYVFLYFLSMDSNLWLFSSNIRL